MFSVKLSRTIISFQNPNSFGLGAIQSFFSSFPRIRNSTKLRIPAKSESSAESSDEERADEGPNLGDQGSEESESGEESAPNADPEVEAESSNHGGDSEATLELPGNGMENQVDVDVSCSPSGESMENLTEADSDSGAVSVKSTPTKTPQWREELFTTPQFGNSGPPKPEIIEMCIGLMQFFGSNHPDIAKYLDLFRINLFLNFICVSPFIHPSIFLSIYSSIFSSLHLSIHHSIHPTIPQSIHLLSMSLSVYVSVYLLTYPSINPLTKLPIYPSVYPHMNPLTHVSIDQTNHPLSRLLLCPSFYLHKCFFLSIYRFILYLFIYQIHINTTPN